MNNLFMVDGITGYITDGKGNYFGHSKMSIEKSSESKDGMTYKVTQKFVKLPKSLQITQKVISGY